ncbi:MAG TPA: MarR family transcriptional regulator [Sporomusaceae bacterium]|nr:MarR family transcriptional regulator [Sporomusaceae bacterium]
MSITKDIIFFLKKIQENTELLAPSIVGELTLSQIHCLSVIGDIENANVTKISNELEMTTGAITKMCKKLFNQGFIEKYQEPGNNQKKYYRLTESGQKLYSFHKKIHDEIHEDKKSIIARYTEDEKAIILRFLNDVNSMITNRFKDFKQDDDKY